MTATVPAPVGWNTWDVQYHTGWTHLPSGLRIRFALRSADGVEFDGFTWRHGLVRLGHHTVDGRYAVVDVKALGTTLRLECSGGGDEFAAFAECRNDGGLSADLLLLVDRGFADDPVSIVARLSGAVAVTFGDTSWLLECFPQPTTMDVERGCLSFAPGTALSVLLRPEAEADTTSSTPYEVAAEVRSRLAGAQRQAARMRTSGWLADSADAMTRALTWNTIFAPDLGRVLTPTSRDFVCREREGFYGRWALHTWDTFFTGLVSAWVDPAYAQGIFEQIIEHATPAGMLPNRVSDDRGRTDDRSQPPVGAYTVLKAYLGSGLSDQTRRVELLRATYPALAAWHAWWGSARTGPYGVLAWGSDPVSGDRDSATVDRAKRESGLDDSPMYDEAVLDPASHTMNLADVGLNALYLVDADALATIAERLGEPAAGYRERARDTARKFDDTFWDAEAGLYRNRWAGGEFSAHSSPTLLYPLLAGIPDRARAEAIATVLLRPDALGGDPPLPSTARDDPGFSSHYWRGRVWGPMAFLAVQGLRRQGLDEHSRPIVAALLRLFLREWTEHSHVRENYPVLPGEDVRPLAARSDGLMGWGGLLGYLAIQELADARTDGWRFAHPGEDATVDGLALTEGRLAVRAADRLVVALDGRPVLDLPRHISISGFERTDNSVRGVLHGIRDGADRILLAVPPCGGDQREIQARVDGQTVNLPVGPGGLVSLVAPGERPVPILLSPVMPTSPDAASRKLHDSGE